MPLGTQDIIEPGVRIGNMAGPRFPSADRIDRPGCGAASLYAMTRDRHRIRITIDGKTIVERAVMCTASNTFRIGMSMPLAPAAKRRSSATGG